MLASVRVAGDKDEIKKKKKKSDEQLIICSVLGWLQKYVKNE